MSLYFGQISLSFFDRNLEGLKAIVLVDVFLVNEDRHFALRARSSSLAALLDKLTVDGDIL